MKVKINLGGITRCDIRWKAEKFIRVHHCIMFLLEGEAHYVSEGEDVLIVPGHFYITPTNKIYEITQNPAKLMHELYFHIDGIYNMPNKLIDIDTEERNNIIIKNIIGIVMTMMEVKTDFSIIEKQLEVLLELLLIYKTQDIRIKTIMQFITENYNKKITNKDIASVLNIDVDYLGRLFKSKMNITLFKYIEKYRIEKACKLVLDNVKIDIVSQKVGYEDSKSFLRAFKRNKKTTVSQYKKSRFLQP